MTANRINETNTTRDWYYREQYGLRASPDPRNANNLSARSASRLTAARLSAGCSNIPRTNVPRPPEPRFHPYMPIPAPVKMVNPKHFLREFGERGSYHPCEFIQQIEGAVESGAIPYDQSTRCLRQQLRGNAHTWSLAMLTDQSDYRMVREAFLEKFWGRDQQISARCRLETQRYSQGSYLHHFYKQWSEARYLLDAYPEAMLLSLISRQYPPELEISLKAAQTVAEFESRLTIYDRFRSSTCMEEHRRLNSDQRSETVATPQAMGQPQRIPSPRELQQHTQSIMQRALLKKKLEEQQRSFSLVSLVNHLNLPIPLLLVPLVLSVVLPLLVFQLRIFLLSQIHALLGGG